MSNLSVIVETPNGLTVIEVDPPLAQGEVDIELEPAVSRATTRRMSAALRASLLGQCR